MKEEPKLYDMRTLQNNQVKAIVAKYANLASNTEPAKTIMQTWKEKVENSEAFPSAELESYNYTNQLIARIYQLKAGVDADSEVSKAYSKNLSHYFDGMLSSDEEQFLADNFDLFVDYAFKEGKSFNEFNTLRLNGFNEWSAFVPYILEKKSGKIFVPVSDSGCELKGLGGNCDITVDEDYANAAIRAFAYGQLIHQYKATKAGQWSDIEDGYFEAAIICKSSNLANTVSVQQRFDAAYRIVKEGGEIILSVSHDDLLSDVTSAMRHFLMENRILRKVIMLPSGNMILHIVKKTQDKCVMIDASDMFECRKDYIVDAEAVGNIIEQAGMENREDVHLVKSCSYEELKEEILLPAYYLSLQGEEKPIGDILDICSNLVISDDCAPNEKVVSVNNLSHVFAKASFQVDELPSINKDRLRRYYRINGPAVVMAVSKQNIAIGYTTETSSFLVPKNIYALKPQKRIDVKFLACALLSNLTKSQLMMLVIGNGLESELINKWAEVVCCEKSAMENEQAFIQSTMLKDYAEQKKYVELQEQNFKRNIRLRKHALSQNISAFDSLFHTLEYCMNENMGKLNVNDKISSISDMTVGEAMLTLRSDLDVICHRVSHLTDEQDWGKCEAIEPQSFIEDYERLRRELSFRFEHRWWDVEPNLFEEDIYDEVTGKLLFHKGETLNAAWFPKRALLQVFDNIVSNAREHGFKDKKRTDYVIHSDWTTDGLYMIIRISNNGESLQEGIDASKVLEYGYSTVLNQSGHGGIGGGEIAEIMHRFGGDVKVLSMPNEKFTVTYVLTMPLASVY